MNRTVRNAAMWLHSGIVLGAILLSLVSASPAHAQDRLIFCNEPERIRGAGTYAEAALEADKTYTVFYHYRNDSRSSGDFVLALRGAAPGPVRLSVRQGLADPIFDPPLAGRQAMARFFKGGERILVGPKGQARFSFRLAHRKVASGVLVITPEEDCRLRIYYKHDRWKIRQARTVVVDAPRRDVEISLSDDARKHSVRIGEPEEGMSQLFDGTYGMVYHFKIDAPTGSRVRVLFSPRGGKGGVVGSLNGSLVKSGIIPARGWRKLCETTVGQDGVTLSTAPFGGVFYPVELVFQLM